MVKYEHRPTNAKGERFILKDALCVERGSSVGVIPLGRIPLSRVPLSRIL